MTTYDARPTPKTTAGTPTPSPWQATGAHQDPRRLPSQDGRREVSPTHTTPPPAPGPVRSSTTAVEVLTPPVLPVSVEPAGADEDAGQRIRITLLGGLEVSWCEAGGSQHDITAALPPKVRELLIFLAVHPDGVGRDAVLAALWPEYTQDSPTNALHTALSRLRRAAATATAGTVTRLMTGVGRYRLDPEVVTVDYWHFLRAVAAHRAALTREHREDRLRAVVRAYRGPLAHGCDYEWIDALRETARRDALDAVAALARILVDTDPEQTLGLLETARELDPHHELLYRDIMRLQGRLGRADAVERTLGLLVKRLAEIGEHPTPETTELAARLCGRAEAETTRTPRHPVAHRVSDARRTGR
ncbi:AfsR/SARP family transcriptional regulator [Allokutzneria oryzae]|uniref:BTAD domain-containing putative transcriptional regulator n=1 Tax=Allokutzneria oryzae TaxID=1378989 RepID=A0ABV5ZT08_9PSEU